MNPQVILDASALLAYLQQEQGHLKVSNVLRKRRVAISTVNLGEVYKKIVEKGKNLKHTIRDVEDLEITILPFEKTEAEISAQLYPIGKPYGLSLADRACLAVGIKFNSPVWTTEERMTRPDLAIGVYRIR